MPTADLSRGPLYSIMAGDGAIFTEAYGADSNGLDGGIFRTTDNGDTWTPVTSGLSDPQSLRNPVFCEGRIFAGNEKGGFQSTDMGTNWTPIDIGFNLPDPVHFLPTGGPRLFALKGHSIVLLRSNDCGDSWFFQNPIFPVDALIAAVAVSHPYLVVGAIPGGGPRGDVYRSTDNGETWFVANSGLPPYPVVMQFALADDLVLAAIGNKGIYRSLDHGLTWSPANTGLTSTHIQSIVAAGSHLFAGTYSGLFHSADHGSNWELVDSGLPDTIGIHYLAATDTHLFLAMYDGRIWKRPLAEISMSIRKSDPRIGRWGFEVTSGALLGDGAGIPFSIAHGGEVEVSVLDMKGIKLRTLLKSRLGAGWHGTVLDADGLSSGLYFLRLHASGTSWTRRFVLEN